jgi:hypothetical protein
MRPLFVGLAAALAIGAATDLANAQSARERTGARERAVQAASAETARVRGQRFRVASVDFAQRRTRCYSILCPGFIVLGVGF